MPWQEVTDPDEIAAAMASSGSGAAATSMPVMDTKSRLQLQATGVPVLNATRDPFARIADPKQRAMAQQRMLAASQTALDKQGEVVTGAQTQLGNLSEFEALNEKGITGGFGGWMQSKLPSWLQSDDAQRLEQLSTGMARGNRIPGEGTISDFDAAQFMRMTGGLDKSKAANDAYLRAAKAVQRSAIDRKTFMDAFVSANGTTVGADALWKQYSDANPLFDPKTNQFKGQRPDWSTYFAGRAQTKLAGGNPDARVGMIGSQKRSGPAQMGPRRIKGDADYNALPRGARYVGPDGVERVK